MKALYGRGLHCLILWVLATGVSHAQFLDTFDRGEIERWFFFTGDGEATMDFVPMDGFARIQVDATNDRHNVWWAIIKRDVSSALDLEKLAKPGYELRVEARVRTSHAPRRINFMLNTQKTTDYHEHLREYDISDTSGWHVISMTTRNFDAVPGDAVFVQLGVTDWGLGAYHVDLDYYRAEVVEANRVQPDLGEPLVYHPVIPAPDTFSHHLEVAHDSLIHSGFPEVNFNDWHARESEGRAPVLTVGTNQSAILRWDLGPFREAKAAGAGVLELTTQSVAKGGDFVKTYGEDLGVEFGKVRVIEVLAGDPLWDQATVTYDSFGQGEELSEVINGQMIIDVEVSEEPGSRNLISISRPVMQRLLDGRTKGLVLRPLGAVDASFYASEDPRGNGPKLYFNIVR